MQERTKLVKVRLTPEERSFIEEQADKANLTLSEFVRKRALGKRLVSRFDDKVLNELRRQGGLLKHLAAIYPEQREQLSDLIQQSIITLRKLY
jgi:hypothetical protein